MNRLINKWNDYKYRFVPWIALHIKNRQSRIVQSREQDKIISDKKVIDSLLKLLPKFYKYDGRMEDSLIAEKNNEVMTKVMGFTVHRAPSSLYGMQGSGLGVFIRNGVAPKGSLVALYPGTIYRQFEPILIQSLGNPFIFRCLDGMHIDGKDTGISKAIYKSCVRRDSIGSFLTSDMTWLTQHCINPMNVGQYVNNQSKDALCNVAYQEVDVPEDGSIFSLPELSLLPNAFYSANFSDSSYDLKRKRRLIALISIEDIPQDTEASAAWLVNQSTKTKHRIESLEENCAAQYLKGMQEARELDEFQENSRELEAQLEQVDKRNKDLCSMNNRLQLDLEATRDKLEQVQKETEAQISDIQTQLAGYRGRKEEWHKYIRELEQANDDLERAKRAMLVSVEDFESRLNLAIERNAFLESELDEKESLRAMVQRLKDEARDMKQELQVRERDIPEEMFLERGRNSVYSNKFTVEMETQTAIGSPLKSTQNDGSSPVAPLTPSARISTLNIVGDLIRKAGALESKLASCHNLAKESPRHGDISNKNVLRGRHLNRTSMSPTVQSFIRM